MQRMRSARTVVTIAALGAAVAFLGAGASAGHAAQTNTNPPTIDSFTPTAGPVGKLVTITGTHLKNLSAVSFGKVGVMWTTVSSTTITAHVPMGAVTAPIKVTKNMTTVKSATNFIVTPKITSFSPSGGAVGTLVTIRGTTFNGATEVDFGTVAADLSTAVLKPSTIKVYVPAGAVTAKIYVTTPSGTAHTSTAFKVT